MRKFVFVVFVLITACSSVTGTSQTNGVSAAWQTMQLTDVRNGRIFTFADLKGKTVYVETMATWCGNCRMQLRNVLEAKEKLNDDSKYVFVGISVETDLNPADLADYSKNTGYDWTFVRATPELLSTLTETFGRSIINPPATPHFVIYPDGSFSKLSAGEVHSTEDIIGQLTASSQG